MRIRSKCFRCGFDIPGTIDPMNHTFSVTLGSLNDSVSDLGVSAETYILCAACYDSIKEFIAKNPETNKHAPVAHVDFKISDKARNEIPKEESSSEDFDGDTVEKVAPKTKKLVTDTGDTVITVNGKHFSDPEFIRIPDSVFKNGVLSMCQTAKYIREHKMAELKDMEQAMKVSDVIDKAADDDILRCKVNENGYWVELVKRKDKETKPVEQVPVQKLNLLTSKSIRLTGKQCSMSGTRLWNLRYCQESSGMTIPEFAEFYNVSETKIRNLLIDVCASKTGRKYGKALQPYSPKGDTLTLFKSIAKDFDCKLEDLCKVYHREFAETLEFNPAAI